MIETKQEMNEMCATCGLCCTALVINMVGLSAEDVHFWATTQSVNGNLCCVKTPCRQYKDGRCSIYDIRPKKCRDLEVNGKACQFIRHAHGL